MGTDTPQPQETKAWLIRQGLRAIAKKSRRKLARVVLLDGAALPGEWLSERQRSFLALRSDATVKGRALAEAIELLRRVVHLCDQLLPQLIDSHLACHNLNRAPKRLHRHVLIVLLASCDSWPSAGTEGLDPLVCAAMGEELHRGRPRPTSADGDPVLVRSGRNPVDQRDFEERIITQTGSSRARYSLASQFLWDQESRHAMRIGVLLAATGTIAILYVALFLTLRSVEPALTAREAALVVGSAIGAAVGGTGLGLLGLALRTRWSPGRPGNEPQPARSEDEDPVRPVSR